MGKSISDTDSHYLAKFSIHIEICKDYYMFK